MVEIQDLTRKKELKKYQKDICHYYQKVLDTLNLEDDFKASLIVVGNQRIKTINSKYRGIDRPTDVISFAEVDGDEDFLGDDSYLGDIFINVDRVKSQAKRYGHSVKREYCFLFVHGMLHLFGYDHMNPSDEKRMFDIQDKIIGDLK